MAWIRGERRCLSVRPEKARLGPISGFHKSPQQPADGLQPVDVQSGSVEKRFNVVFLISGLPLVIGETKTPMRSAVTLFDGAFQVNGIYEKQVPATCVPNVFSFATEGRLFPY